jgi:hypothetical protein
MGDDLQNTLSTCAILGCFNSCCLKKPFTLLLDVRNDLMLHEATFFHFQASQLFHIPEELLLLDVSSCQQ